MLALAAALSLSCSAPAAIDDPVARVDAFLRGETRLDDLGVFALARDPSPEAQEAWARMETGLAFLTMQSGPNAGPGCKWSLAEAQMVLARAVDGNCEISLEPGAMLVMEEVRLTVQSSRNSTYEPSVVGLWASFFAPADAHRMGFARMQAAYPDRVTMAWYLNELGQDWCYSRRDVAFFLIESWVVKGEGWLPAPPPEYVRAAMTFPEATTEFRIHAQAWLDEHDPQ